jgi:hypothetical protein
MLNSFKRLVVNIKPQAISYRRELLMKAHGQTWTNHQFVVRLTTVHERATWRRVAMRLIAQQFCSIHTNAGMNTYN